MTRPPPIQTPWSQERRFLAILWLAMSLALAWAYHGVLNSPFFFDDLPAIADNPSIRHLGDLGAVLSPPSADGNGVGGRPLVNLSLAINWAISADAVWSYHAFNVLVHLMAALVLFGLVRRTLAARGESYSNSLGFAVALLWALHPLLSESVTCVVQRTESMMGLFYFLTLYGLARSAASPGQSRWSLLSFSACLLGMATKETMVTAPIVALLYDRTFLSGTFAAAWRLRRKIFLGLGSTWILLAILVAKNGGARGSSAGFGLGVTPWTYALTQCRAIVHYLKLSVWPHPLSVDYGTEVATSLGAVLPQGCALVLLLSLIAIGLIAEAPPKRAAAFLGAWFFVILAPSSSVVPLIAQTIAEHRMYLPLAGLICLGVTAGWRLAKDLGTWAIRIYFALLALVGLVEAFGTARRNEDYRTPQAIWTQTVEASPDNPRARTNLGEVLFQQGEIKGAVDRYREALAIDPSLPATHYDLGVALVKLGDFSGGTGEFEKALSLHPNAWICAQAHCNLGTLQARIGQLTEAIANYSEALRIQPDYSEAQVDLATALLQSGRREEALAQYQTALELDPRSAAAHFNVANLLAGKGQWDQAIAHYHSALAIDPSYARAHCNLGSALARAGYLKEALPEFQEALRLDPDMSEARSNLSRVQAYLSAHP